MPDSVNPDARILTLTLTTPARDRQGDILEPRGLDFSNYLKNPVVLWAHDLDRPPVGRCLSVTVTDEGVCATVQFADTTFARDLFSLYAGGFMHAWSIGFIPEKSIPLTGNFSGAGGQHIQAAEVVEISAVAVPANPEALTHALKTVQHPELRAALGKSRKKTRVPVRPIAAAKAGLPGHALSFRQLATLADDLMNHLTTRAVQGAAHTALGRL